jgi:DNA processing protein
MTEREARIAFNMIPTIGSVTVARLAAEAGGSVAEAYARYPDKRDWEGKEPEWEREIARAAKMHVTIVTELDDAYPPLLKEIASPPLALYVTGDAAVLSKAGVALVGTRAATAYGRETAERLAAGLAQRGWAVFSGLAAGIDAAAHRGALVGGGATAGVLGGALDCFFPNENRKLAREMVEKGGCVASEFPFGRRPDAQTFPQRNRIVSGLSHGVVAVECPLRSGTLITCSRAAEQGRAVMAVPGRVDWKVAAGCNQLIREGARLVTSVDDILEELTPLGKEPKVEGKKKISASGERRGAADKRRPTPVDRRSTSDAPQATFTLEESLVLRAIPEGGATIDAVAREAKLPMEKVNALLVGLRLKGRVRFLPGNRVAVAG